jgi:hypothetical protein
MATKKLIGKKVWVYNMYTKRYKQFYVIKSAAKAGVRRLALSTTSNGEISNYAHPSELYFTKPKRSKIK